MDIISFFSLLFGKQWYAQWIGVIAIVVSFIGFQNKNARRIFAYQITTNALWSLHMLLIGAYTGMILNIIGLARSFLLYSENKPYGKSKISMAIVMLAFTIGGIISWNGWQSILSTLAMGTPLLWTRHAKVIRFSQILLISPLWLYHNILVCSVAGTITECVTIVSVFISIIRYDISPHSMFLKKIRH